MHMGKKRRRLASCGIASAGLLAAGLTLIPDAHADQTRVETAVDSGSPIAGVAESMVSVKVPLPASAGAHPAECDWLSYLRWRDAAGPAASAEADKVLIAQPGVLEGASAFDSVARNTVTAAAATGKHIEFWALDRRSNCLEDRTGQQAALAANDPQVALDYYYNKKPVNGKTFAGFLNNDQTAFLANVGLEQTERDQYDLMLAELPDPQFRKQKVLCGGHSLGGILTGFFVDFDFDGDPNTTADAGFNQCAGTFALDSQIATSLASIAGGQGMAPAMTTSNDFMTTQAQLQSGLLPRTASGPALINAETMNLLSLFGVAAKVSPDGVSQLANKLPASFNIDATLRVLFSKDFGAFASGNPNFKQFSLTNATALGALLDDQSEPLAFLQTSVGFFAGGPVATKDFPVPADLANNPNFAAVVPLVGKDTKAIPDQPNGPTYTWLNYNQIAGAAIPNAKNGTPFTNAGKEVTDIQELARSLSAHSLDFTEQYFPTKLITDVNQGTAPQIAGLAPHAQGIQANPVITFLAGDGLGTVNGQAPPGVANPVVAPGYQHLDVLTAAPTQNNGQPEVVSTNLARFALSVGA